MAIYEFLCSKCSHQDDLIRKMDDDNRIGAVDLFEYDAIHRRAGIGIIIENEYRKNGFALQAIEMICEYAFSHLNLYQVCM